MKKALFALTAVTALGASGLTYFALSGWLGVPGELYRYYPEDTGFYLELAPGEALLQKFTAHLTKEAEAEVKESEHQLVLAFPPALPPTVIDTTTELPDALKKFKPQPKNTTTLKTPQTKTTKPAVTTTPNKDPKNTATAEVNPEAIAQAEQAQTEESIRQTQLEAVQNVQLSRFRKAFLKNFSTTFQPYFSLGAWPNPKYPVLDANEPNHLLVVLPLQKPMKLTELVRQFDLKTSDFKLETLQKYGYWVDDNSGTALTILNQQLLVANTPDAMRATLAHYDKKRTHVFESPAHKTYLAKLPPVRQGTFILNNTIYAPRTWAMQAEGMGKTIGDQLNAFSPLAPLTVGSVQLKQGNLATLRFLTPVLLRSFPNKDARQQVQALSEMTEPFNQARQLPVDTGLMIAVAGTDKLFDLYRSSMMPIETTSMLKFADFYLSGFHLELRRDLIGLFEHRTVMATRGSSPSSLILMLDKNEQKDKSLDQISALLSTNMFPVRMKPEQVGDLSVKTLLMGPLAPTPHVKELSYGTVNGSIVMASPKDYLETTRVAKGQQKSLARHPLYYRVTKGLPARSNVMLYMNLHDHTDVLGQDWLEAIGLSLRTEPFKENEITLLDGQLNLQFKTPGH